MPNEVEITITANDMSGAAFAGVLGKLAALQAAAKALQQDLGKIGAVKMDAGQMASSLTALKAKIQQLGIADIADINVPYGRLITQMNIIKRFIDQAGISDLLDVNIDPQKLSAQIGKLRQMSETIPINWAVSPLPGGLIGKNLNENVLVNVQGANQASAALNNVATAASAAMGSSGGAGRGGGGGSGLLGAAAAGGFFGGIWNNLTGQIFSGGKIWAGSLFAIGAWHIALDATIEALISVGLATAAAAVGVLAMSEAAQNIYTHLQAVNTVSSALGQNIPPLTGAIGNLTQAMAPQTIEIYGQGLRLVSSQTGMLMQVAKPVVTLFDDWAAKIVIWAQSQHNFGSLMQAGIGYLKQFGQIFGTVGQALGNLLHDDPGIAHFLLDVIQGLASVLKYATMLPGPLVGAALAFHGLYVWGKFLGGALFSLVNSAAGWVRLLPQMAVNPFAWAVVAAAAIGYLAYQSTQADKATKSFISNMNAGLANDSATQAITQINIDIGQIVQRMHDTNVSTILKGWSSSWAAFAYDARASANLFGGALEKIFSPNGNVLKGIGQLGDAIMSIFKPGAGASIVLQNDLNALNAELKALTGQYTNIYAAAGTLVSRNYTLAESFAILDLAGVRSTDTYQVMMEKVDGLIKGYNSLGISGSLLTNSVNAVTFASLIQGSQVQQLIQGWDTFEGIIQGGETDLFKFNNTIVNLNTTLGKNAGAVDTLGKKQSQQIQYFTVAAAQANTEMDSLTNLAAAASLGAKGTSLLQQATKDMIASMLPAAKNSQTFTAILYALAQRGGYHGADSFKALSTWVGNTKNPMKDLQGIVQTLTIKAAGLTTDVKNLSVALGTTLNNAMATAIITASGGVKPLDNLATAIKNTGLQSDQTRTAAQKVANEFFSLTGNTDQTKNEFITFTEKLGLTRSAADQLWNSVKNHLNPSLYTGPGSTWASANAATDKVNGLKFALQNLPKNVATGVHVNASGSGYVSFQESSSGFLHAEAAKGALKFHAAGGWIGGSGGPTSDNQLIAASPGEFIVNAKSAQAIGPAGMAAINSYAAGGLVEPVSNPYAYANQELAAFARETERNTVQAAYAALKNSIRSAAQAGITGGNAGANAGQYEMYALRLFPQHGWGGIQMTGLVPLWTRESGWDPLAMNASSGAFGIAQALGHGLPGTAGRYGNQYPSLAANNGNAAAQIQWGEDYIAGQYGTPLNAWAHELAAGWYGGGLDAVVNGPALLGVGERGAEHVRVTPVHQRGSGSIATIELQGGAQDLQQFLAKVIRRIVIHEGGGDVQEAFGQALS